LHLRNSISRFVAGFVLVVFAFGITPKLALHNLVANHKDRTTRHVHRDPGCTHWAKAGFHCPIDNLVVESPFVPGVANSFVLLKPQPAASFIPAFPEAPVPVSGFTFSLRGPPTC
jgi:hypothetical protein